MAVFIFHAGQLVDTAKYRFGRRGNQSFAYAERVYLSALNQHITNDVLIQGVGSTDFAVLKTGSVQHFPRFAGKIGNITAVDADARGTEALGNQYFVEDFDSVGYARFQYVIGIYQ